MSRPAASSGRTRTRTARRGGRRLGGQRVWRREENERARRMMSSLFGLRKQALKQQVLLESFHSVDYDVVQAGGSEGGMETRAEQRFERLLKEDRLVATGGEFMRTRGDTARSELFSVISRMPKGALLHTHGIATGPFEALVDFLRADGRVFVHVGADSTDCLHGEMRYLGRAEASRLGASWKPAGALPATELLSLLELPAGLSREQRWPVFQNIWMRVRELSDSLPVWDGEGSYFWHMLTSLLSTGVTYVEMKQLVPEGWVKPSADGASVRRDASIDDFMRVFTGTVRLFQARNPRFVGAKMIWCSLKVLPEPTVRAHTETVLRLMRAFPDAIAGFDLVGHEDTLTPIAAYQQCLAAFRERGGRLILHAGETLEPDADQIYDAVALGASRIGHAYSLPKFPALMRIVRDKGITVECCPISNQSLGYVDDLRNHPGLVMLNNGLRLTISSDDAAIFGYSDLSYDFCAVAKAWGLSLTQLKHLARASFKCTALSGEEQVRAERQFDADWALFIKHILQDEHRPPAPPRTSLRISTSPTAK